MSVTMQRQMSGARKVRTEHGALAMARGIEKWNLPLANLFRGTAGSIRTPRRYSQFKTDDPRRMLTILSMFGTQGGTLPALIAIGQYTASAAFQRPLRRGGRTLALAALRRATGPEKGFLALNLYGDQHHWAELIRQFGQYTMSAAFQRGTGETKSVGPFTLEPGEYRRAIISIDKLAGERRVSLMQPDKARGEYARPIISIDKAAGEYLRPL